MVKIHMKTGQPTTKKTKFGFAAFGARFLVMVKPSVDSSQSIE
jgi:hypothetical protein